MYSTRLLSVKFFMATLSGPASVTCFLVERFSYPKREVDAAGSLDLSFCLSYTGAEVRHRFKTLLGLGHQPAGFCGSIGSQDNDL
jgi:hypothetical protein